MSDEPEREVMETDVVIVGAGPAGLSCAIHLARQAKEKGRELAIMVLEKSAEIGQHILSGAVMDPRGMAALFPDWRERGCPIEADVAEDAVWWMSEKSYTTFPITPRPFRNHGNVIVSLGDITRWLAQEAEALEVEVFSGFPAQSLLLEEGKVVGVRTGDMGVDKDGNPKGTFQPGMDIRARLTVLAEGVRGHLTKKLAADQGLYQVNPQVYSTGIKEVWKLKQADLWPAGKVVHTMDWPLNRDTFGGTWIYGMKDGHVSIGLVVGLDSPDPKLDPHNLFTRWKQHPALARVLEGGELISYGAKTIPDGGWYSRPKSVVDGALIIGDAGGNLDPQKLKGIHLAIQTGMCAAETALEAAERDDFTGRTLGGFEDRVAWSFVKADLWRSRNFRGPFQKGFWTGMLHAGIQEATGGWTPGGDPYPLVEDHHRTRKITEKGPTHSRVTEFDGDLALDKLADVFKSGTEHDEDQPSHLRVADLSICETRCKEEYGNPCQYFCPAAVYEMVPKEDAAEGVQRLQINFSNCVHCKTCDIADPYAIITWVAPEGGGGPRYRKF